jgi:hypothetical protein
MTLQGSLATFRELLLPLVRDFLIEPVLPG